MGEPTLNLDGSGVRLAIAVARFNEYVTTRLLDGALEAVKACGSPDPEVHWVPGSFELPVVALHLARSGRSDAVVCLGAVIRHETDHYRYVADSAANGISRVALNTGIPCLFGVLTCDTEAQALARAGGPGVRNAGRDAVEAAIATVNLLRGIGPSR
jgi:6,7-dimethyl-8-ribityllumazine synthase